MMMKARYVLYVAAALVMAACAKENLEQKDFDFSLTVRNEDGMEELVLQGVGESKIVAVDNLPAWVPGIMLKEESFRGDPVAVVGVKADYDLEDTREARIVITMSNGITVNLTLTQWPILKGGTNDVYKSSNREFEADWASAREVTLVTSYEFKNGKPEVTTLKIPLPWDWNHSPASYLPRGGASDTTLEVYKMIENKADWSLVFNLTGIDNLPGRHYFGLYNRYTGVLRIFYYLTEDLLPSANDHMWSFSLNAALAEHLSAQFTIPRGVKPTPAYLANVAMPVLTTPTTDKYNPLSGSTSNVLAVGWWAFDVNMSAYRDNKFFSVSPLNAANIQLCTYSEEKVVLNSVLQGNLGGSLEGSVNLELLRPSSVNTYAKVGASIMGGIGSMFTNTYWLNEVCGKRAAGNNGNVQNALDQPQLNPNNGEANNGEAAGVAQRGAANAPVMKSQTKSIIAGCVSILIGTALSVGAKFIESIGSKKVEDNDFGSLNATMNLDLNAVMATQGTIGAPLPNKVPPVAMSMEYFKEKNPDGSFTCLGDGVWNLEQDPVIYVVNDAYWYENKFTVLSTQKEYPVGENSKFNSDVYSYYLGATKGSRPGLRLITFMDPTSVKGAAFNPQLFNESFKELKVYLSYGVYPGSEPGYTDYFRRDAGMDYPHSWHLDIRKNNKQEYTIDTLKLIRKVHTDELFKWAGAPEGAEGTVGVRLSSQKLRADRPGLERRYCGQSVYYSNPYATEFVVDKVQYVYDPQVYLPFDEAGHRLYDPQVPDFVVTATVNAYGTDKKDQGQPSVLTNTLRFLPQIKLVSYKDLPAIYKQILKQKEQMSGPAKTTFVEMQLQIDHIGEIVNAVSVLK